jgi:excisionase family DNA binding protein
MAGDEPATPAPATSPWLTVREAAQRAHVGPRLIYAAIAAGRLRAAKLSGRGCFRVHETWLDAFLVASAAPVDVVPARRRA